VKAPAGGQRIADEREALTETSTKAGMSQ